MIGLQLSSENSWSLPLWLVVIGGRATMTSIEDWSLSTLSSQIFRQQTQLQLRSGNSRFFGGRPSWKATGLQLQSGNSRFFGGRSCCNATGLLLQSGNSRFFGLQAQLENDRATTVI